jgi:hypothetical protein
MLLTYRLYAAQTNCSRKPGEDRPRPTKGIGYRHTRRRGVHIKTAGLAVAPEVER